MSRIERFKAAAPAIGWEFVKGEKVTPESWVRRYNLLMDLRPGSGARTVVELKVRHRG